MKKDRLEELAMKMQALNYSYYLITSIFPETRTFKSAQIHAEKMNDLMDAFEYDGPRMVLEHPLDIAKRVRENLDSKVRDERESESGI